MEHYAHKRPQHNHNQEFKVYQTENKSTKKAQELIEYIKRYKVEKQRKCATALYNFNTIISSIFNTVPTTKPSDVNRQTRSS